MQNKVLKLIIWFVAGAAIAVVGESNWRGTLMRYPSIINTLIIGFAGGFLGFVFGLMADKAKEQNIEQAENQPDLKRAVKSFSGIFLRGYLIFSPLMIIALWALFLKPFQGWINNAIAILCLVIAFLYYIFFQMKKVSTFYQQEVGGPMRYKFKGKDFALMVVLILVGFGLVAAIPYFFFSEKNTPNIQQEQKGSVGTTSNDEIADWQTYRNDEYGFEVKYPNEWFLEEPTTLITVIRPWERKGGISADTLRDIQIRVFPTKIEKDYQLNYYEDEISLKRAGFIGDVKIGSYEGKEMRIVSGFPENEFGYRFIILEYNDMLYELSVFEQYAQMDIFYQMLSTFKFID
ncbi:hypothetical protein L6252_03310 [Candidatus Parcubacteria bacterium]|nr:hypothetical protein [Candidatus Parcubacteria bacterium]